MTVPQKKLTPSNFLQPRLLQILLNYRPLIWAPYLKRDRKGYVPVCNAQAYVTSGSYRVSWSTVTGTKDLAHPIPNSSIFV